MADDSKHPSDMSADERAALVASDPAAFDEDDAVDTATATGDETNDTPAETDAGNATAAADDAAADDDTAKPVDQRAFNGVLSDLRDTRAELSAAQRELQALREKFNAAEAPPARDFAAERKALKEKFDDGELDDDDYQEQREALLLEEAEQKALAKFTAQQQQQRTAQQQSQADQVAADWDAKLKAWMTDNSEFCSNPLRVDALGTLIQTLGADTSLSNEDLLKAVEAKAFEAFNWEKPGAAARHAGRNAADAAAAARASATPPSLSAGVGVGARGSGEGGGVDMEHMKPGQFSKLPRAEQERLLGEGALD